MTGRKGVQRPVIGEFCMYTFRLAFFLLASPVLAQGSGSFHPDQAVQVTGVGTTLNVREGPGTIHPVVASLAAERTGLTILECNLAANWCRIGTAGDPLGWVAARYLTGEVQAARADIGADVDAEDSVAAVAEPAFSEAARLGATGIVLDPGGTTTVPELPPYLLGAWHAEGVACADATQETQVTVQENGLRIGAATARFKTALFRDGGYDLTTLLMEEQNMPNAVPQRALYRLEPGEETLAVSGDVLATLRLRRCEG